MSGPVNDSQTVSSRETRDAEIITTKGAVPLIKRTGGAGATSGCVALGTRAP